MKKLYILLFANIFLFAILACDDEVTDLHEKNYTLELSKDTVVFNTEGGLKSVQIFTNQESWEAVYEENPWFTSTEFRNADGYEMITMEADSSTSLSQRESVVNITAGPYQTKLYVIQIGNEPTIYLNLDSLTLDKDTAVVNLPYISNIDFEIENPASWIQAEKTVNSNNETVLRLLVGRNETGAGRETKLLLKQNNGEFSTSLFVAQSADYGKYEALDIDKVKSNKQIKVISGTASSSLGENFGIEKAFDGNLDSYFQSDWQESEKIEFTFKLETSNDKLNYIIYYPSEESKTQSVKTVFIDIKKTGENDFNQIAVKYFDQTAPNMIALNTALENVDEVKFRVLETYADRGSVPSASCAEVEFYTTTALYESIFTDNTCSALKAEVGINEILNIEDVFYQNLARHLYHGTYETARIMDLSAIQKDRRVAKINHASLYEYASGIYFEANEEALVFCGEHTGTSPSIIVLNSTEEREYPLIEGVNKITPDIGGNVYVKNPSDVKIHIASGTYHELYYEENLPVALEKEGKEFEVLDIINDKLHLIVPFGYAQEISGLLNTFTENLSKFVEAAHKFYGVNEASYQVQSRLGIYLDTEDREIESLIHFNKTEFEAICNFDFDAETFEYNTVVFDVLEKLGVAYEPYLNQSWSMANVSSKLFALSYLYENFGFSLIENEELYQSAFQEIIINGKNHEDANNPWTQAVPLWQLYHYLKNVQGVDDYYTQLCNEVKQQASTGNYTTYFMQFTNQLSDIDFSEFFDKWNIGSTSSKPESKAPGGLAYYTENSQTLYEQPAAPNFMMYMAGLGLVRPSNIAALEFYENGIFRHVETYSTDITTIWKPKWTDFKSHMKIVAIGSNGEEKEVN